MPQDLSGSLRIFQDLSGSREIPLEHFECLIDSRCYNFLNVDWRGNKPLGVVNAYANEIEQLQ